MAHQASKQSDEEMRGVGDGAGASDEWLAQPLALAPRARKPLGA